MYQARGVPTTSRSLPARKVATRSISWLARNSLRLNAPASRYTSGRCARVRTTTSSPAWASGSAGSDSFGVKPTRNPPCNGNNSPSATTPDSGTSSEYPHGVFAGSLLNQRCQRNGEFRWIAPRPHDSTHTPPQAVVGQCTLPTRRARATQPTKQLWHYLYNCGN